MASTTLDDSPVFAALQQKHAPALSRVRVEETDATVTLTGIVPSFYVKQLAQEAALPFVNGRKLLNRLVVLRD